MKLVALIAFVMVRLAMFLVALIVAPIAFVVARLPIWLLGPSWIYPICVTFTFDYGGKRFETSYLTTVRKELGEGFAYGNLFQYVHRRDRTSFQLPDGSLLILAPEWPPFVSQGFDPGKKYISRGRWFWLDDAGAPQQIIYGDGATRPRDPGAGIPRFPWIAVTATTERMSDRDLPQALQADKRPDMADKLGYANMLGGKSDFHGILFTGVELVPLARELPSGQPKLEQFASDPGWLPAAASCRYRPLKREEVGIVEYLYGPTSYRSGFGLLRIGGAWTTDGAPHPGGPLITYSTGKEVQAQGFDVLPYRSLAVAMVRAVEWDGMICSGIEPASEAEALAVQFADGRIALIRPSDKITVLAK